MRITGGTYRGRIIKCPPGVIRPAMERMRESMFSILGNIEGLSFLDLFSGSGCIGLEALSRGAFPVDLVEKDFKKKKTLINNLSIADETAKLFLMPVEKFLKMDKGPYDIIHLDPPFPLNPKIPFLEKVAKGNYLKPGGVCMIHFPSEESMPQQVETLRQYDLRKYGGSHLAFYTVD